MPSDLPFAPLSCGVAPAGGRASRFTRVAPVGASLTAAGRFSLRDSPPPCLCIDPMLPAFPDYPRTPLLAPTALGFAHTNQEILTAC